MSKLFKSIRVSDLTGQVGEDKDFVTVIVRRHPDITEPVQFDALPAEIKGLKNAGEYVMLEVNNGERTSMVVSLADFNKLSPNIGDIIKNADGIRGRRKGFRPGLT